MWHHFQYSWHLNVAFCTWFLALYTFLEKNNSCCYRWAFSLWFSPRIKSLIPQRWMHIFSHVKMHFTLWIHSSPLKLCYIELEPQIFLKVFCKGKTTTTKPKTNKKNSVKVIWSNCLRKLLFNDRHFSLHIIAAIKTGIPYAYLYFP